MFVSSVWVFPFATAELSDSPHVPEPTTPCLNNYLLHLYVCPSAGLPTCHQTVPSSLFIQNHFIKVWVFWLTTVDLSDNTINRCFYLFFIFLNAIGSWMCP